MQYCITSKEIEALESRRLMSGTVELVADTLQITGTENSDAIIVSLDKANPKQLDVQINGSPSTFTAADVKTTQIDALGGNDKILVDQKNGVIFIDFVVNGGAGNDQITTGAGNDIIDGGDGNDKITAGAGDDTITGGNGNNILSGGDGNDTIIGGAGRDTLNGGAGDDNLDGGAGRDAIKTGTGNDSIAVDTSNPKEVKDHNPKDQQYQVTDFATLPSQLQALHETLIPGSVVFRVETAGTTYSLYYHFSDDPITYKTVVQTQSNGEIDLVSREVSLSEARPSAIDAFSKTTPNLGLVSVNQLPHSAYDIRYRDATGALQTVQTSEIVWSLDNAQEDQNNDGYSDYSPPDALNHNDTNPYYPGDQGNSGNNQNGQDGSQNQGGNKDGQGGPQNPGNNQNGPGNQQNPGNNQNGPGNQQNPGNNQNGPGNQQNPGNNQNGPGSQQNPGGNQNGPGSQQNPGDNQNGQGGMQNNNANGPPVT